MRKSALYTIFLACALSYSGTILAQTSTENLQKGVEIYNAMRTYMDDLTTKNVKQENIDDIKSRVDKGTQLLNQVIREGNSEEIRAARYFKANFIYEQGFVLGMMGRNREAFALFKQIEADFTAYKEADFPIRYAFFDKNYVIKWENFAPTQSEFLTGYGEVAYNLDEFELANKIIRQGLDHPNSNNWLRYIAVNKLLDVSAKRSDLISNDERVKYAAEAIKAYGKLDPDNLKAVEENNYPKTTRGLDILLENARKTPTGTILGFCTEAAEIAARLEPKNAKVLQLFEVCYKNRAPAGQSFHYQAHQYALESVSIDRFTSEFVGVAATGQYAAHVTESDCAGLSTASTMYNAWNKKEQADIYRKKADKCLAEEEKARKKAEKQARRNYKGGGFNFYTGVYVLPLFNSNPKRDYGAVVNLASTKFAWEFSYLKINRNKENIFDLWIREVDGARQDNISRWDGYYAHVQPKFFMKDGSNSSSYLGILLGYADKKFDALTVNVTNDLDGTISPATFKPAVTQYTLMLNFGLIRLSPGFGADIYWGLGANYSQFKSGNELDREAYTIDNPLLENRKDRYWGFVMRMGLTIGLNLGHGF